MRCPECQGKSLYLIEGVCKKCHDAGASLPPVEVKRNRKSKVKYTSEEWDAKKEATRQRRKESRARSYKRNVKHHAEMYLARKLKDPEKLRAGNLKACAKYRAKKKAERLEAKAKCA